MTSISSVCDRLVNGGELPVLLDAAYAAFEALLVAAEDHQDPASGMFSQFVYAATCAANGRDEILSAPSLPVRPLRPAEAVVDGLLGAGDVAGLVALSKVLVQVLTQAASTAPNVDDRGACRGAARFATEIHRLLTGAEP